MSQSLQPIIELLQSKAAKAPAFPAVFRITLGDAGFITIDMKNSPAEISTQDVAADCTLVVDYQDCLAMVDGSLPVPQAMMEGKIQLEGEAMLAMQLAGLLGAE